MAKGAAPSQDQLFELLKRAAEELKHAQEEARTAIAALQKEQAAHQKTEQELDGFQKRVKGQESQQSTDEQLLNDQIEAERENSKSLAARVKELEAGLEAAVVEREALRQRVVDGDTAISVTQQQEEAKRSELSREHASALDALKAEHAQALETLKTDHANQVESMTAEHQSAVQTMSAEHARALEAVTSERSEDQIEHKAILDDAAGKLVALESQYLAEKDKHQTTAQKLLETRSKVRDLEAAFAGEQERVKGLEAAAKQLADQHEKAMHDADEQHVKATQQLATNFQAAQAEVARVTEAWQQVERQYEALHREMLMTLEQRDDARRLLDNERAERERLSRALQGHR